MTANFSFWIWGLVGTQFLAALSHSLSFIVKQRARNDTEAKLLDLVSNYRSDMGGGIKRSFNDLFIGISTCFTMVYTFGAVINWYFIKTGTGTETWKGLLLIELIAYTILFLLMIRFTFWPPIIVTGLVFIFSLGSYITVM